MTDEEPFEDVTDTVEDVAGEDAAETFEGAIDTAEETVGEDALHQAEEQTESIFDDLEDAATDASIDDVPTDSVTGLLPLPSFETILYGLLGGVPMFLGLVLLGLPGIPVELAVGVLLASLATVWAATLAGRTWPDSGLNHVVSGTLFGVLAGVLAFGVVRLGVLIWALV